MSSGPIKRTLARLRRNLGRAGMRLSSRVAGGADSGRRLRRAEGEMMLGGLAALKTRGLVPGAVVDGGAHRGGWTRLLKSVFPDARVLMIEPQPQHAETLRALARTHAPKLRFEPRLIGPENRDEVDFCVLDDTKGGSGSSVLPENSNVPRHTIRLPMTTLDELIETTGFPAPDLIKLDVQGFELAVLEGGRKALRTARAVLLEVSTWRYNVGGPLLHEVVAWMNEAGFVSYDILGIHRRPDGVLLQIDILFLRRDSELLDDVQTIYAEHADSSD